MDLSRSVSNDEAFAIDLARKLVQRDRVLLGYVDQYKYIRKLGARPSELQRFFDSLPEEGRLGDCHVFVQNELAAA